MNKPRNSTWATRVASPVALYDACVLYPAPLRDLLMHLALVGACQAKWSELIHDEWTRNVLANRPDLRAEQLARTRVLMNAHALDAVVTNFESLIPTVTLPDPNDRHVLAAAITGRAEVIVTYNLQDFPAEALAPYGLEALHPDVFITQLLDLDARAVCLAINRQRSSLRNPPKTVQEMLALYLNQRLDKTVARLEGLSDLL